VTSRTDQALAAAVAVARTHGLSVEEPQLLADGVNVLVHLHPAPVVARVATMTRWLRPESARSLAREVALATALTAAGAAVVPPSDLLPPGPHQHDGLTLSFWRHVELRQGPPTALEAGTALGELHAVLADLPPLWHGTPLDTPLDDLAVFAARGAELGAEPALVERTADSAAPVRGSPRACER
jgi:hypothetical protein